MRDTTKQKSSWTARNDSIVQHITCLSLFVSLTVLLQINNYRWITIWLCIAVVCFFAFQKEMRAFLATTALFGMGYYIFLHSRSYFNFPHSTWDIVFDRFLIAFIILFLFIIPFMYKSPFLLFWNKPKWNNTIFFPWIWSGFHKIKIKHFLMLAISINVVALSPFIFTSALMIQQFIISALLFSIVNAGLEELLWRGVLLSQISQQLGERWAVVITSLGFGLQHYSLGFSWFVCLLFSLGGLFYAGVTVRSTSIFPAFLWHFVLNMLMIWSGIITLSI